jgi:hypothetical protein
MFPPVPACGERAGDRGLNPCSTRKAENDPTPQSPPRKQGGEACFSLSLLAGKGQGIGVSIPAPQERQRMTPPLNPRPASRAGGMFPPFPACGERAGDRGLNPCSTRKAENDPTPHSPPRKQGGDACFSLSLPAGKGQGIGVSIPAPQARRGCMFLPFPACGERAGDRGLNLCPASKAGMHVSPFPCLRGKGRG